MKNGFFARVFIVTVALGWLTGCLPENIGGTTTSTNTSQGSPNPDFQVIPDPTANPAPADDHPAPTPTPPPDPDAPYVIDPAAVLTINNGEAYTASANLGVLVRYPGEAIQMKLSTNATCEGGTWTDFPYETGETSRNLTLGADQLNKSASVSVQFKDYDLVSSACYTKSIIHDSAAPEILFAKYPLTSLQEGEGTQIIYEVTDVGSGAGSGSCRLNSVIMPCAPSRATINVPAMAPGNYTFEVTATDNLGQSATKSVSWQVTAALRTVDHRISVAEYRKWDILFVIDNSGSMEYEQRSMGNRTRNFLQVLSGLDWQIAITTTDPQNIALGDGRFVPITGRNNMYLLNSTMNQTEAQTLLSNTLQRPETGSGSEQGIRSTYRVVERSQTANNPNHVAFFREGANFAVVLISDEDESADTTKNDPQSLMSLIHNTFQGQKNFLFNSIITKPGDTACRQTDGYSYGDRYKVLSDLTGGVLGSVCATDYAAQVSTIADSIRNMAKSFTLSCLPVAGTPITVKRNGVAVTTPFTTNGMTLSFTAPIEPGDYQLTYKCLAE